jgi:hypothetical protein
MTIKKIMTVGLAWLCCLVASNALVAKLLPLPERLTNKPIFYHKTTQLSGWSCGYNPLYNAAKSENQQGHRNRNSSFKNFKTVCSPYLKKLNKQRLDPARSDMLIELAEQLKLKRFVCLTLVDDAVTPLFQEAISVRHKTNLSTPQVDKLLGKELKKRGYSLMRKVKRELAPAQAAIAHFACHIKSEDHWILISVIKDNQNALSLNIFDNSNDPIYENSEITRFIDHIYSYFIRNSRREKRATEQNGSLSTSQWFRHGLHSLFREKTRSSLSRPPHHENLKTGLY